MNASLPATFPSLRSLLAALVFAAAGSSQAAGPAVSAPPHFPDAVHVFNGCHLSTLAYLNRFTAEYPAEGGQPVVVQMRNADGTVRAHTMALVTWAGAWWIRDEYFGVFPLDQRVKGATDLAALTLRAERLYARHAQAALRAGTARPPEPPKQFSAAQRARDVAAAATLIPVAHILFWVTDGAREIPVLFFRPAPGVVAVYDPVHGTGVVECASRDDAKITTLIAGKLGYRVAGIRPEAGVLNGTLVAATTLPAAAFAR